MLNLTELAEDLKAKTYWQITPTEMEDSQYLAMVLHGLKRLFIDTGRARQYNVLNLTTLDDGSYCYEGHFEIDEEEYIKICSQIDFFQKVQNAYNEKVSYTTDALSVTNADKPYANLKDTIANLENERRIVYFKMVRFVLGEG